MKNRAEKVSDTVEYSAPFYVDKNAYGISDATVKNWEKLNTSPDDRLVTRANKRKSQKRMIPLEYVSHKENISTVQKILDYIDNNDTEISCAMLSLGINLLRKNKLDKRYHVEKVLKEYADLRIIKDLVMVDLPNNEFDILGLIYQAHLQEGKKNVIGSYYTTHKIAFNMTRNFDFSNGEIFLDEAVA